MSKRLKQRKITNAIKLWSICIDLTSKLSKMLSYVSKIQNNAKLQNWSKMKIRWVTSQNIQNNAKLQNWSNNNAFHRFDVKTIKTFELGGKTTKVIKLQWIATIWHLNDQNFWVTSQNYKSHQITINCIDLTSKR